MNKQITESSSKQFSLNPNHVRSAIITIVLSVVGYLAFTLWGGWGEVTQAIVNVGVQGTAICLLLSLVNFGLRFIRWQHYLSLLGNNIPWVKSWNIYIAGYSLTTTPGKAGEALRSIFLKDYGMSYRKSLGAFFAERTSDLISVVILSTLGLGLYREGIYLVVLVAFFLIGAIYTVHNDKWLKTLENLAKRKLPERFAPMIQFSLEMIIAFRSCYTWKSLSYGVFLGVVAWAAEGFAFHYILRSLGADIGLVSALFIYNFSLLIGSLSFLPGGLGGAEIALWQLLLLYGQPNSLTIAVTIVIRLTTLWFSVILGLIMLAPCFKDMKKMAAQPIV